MDWLVSLLCGILGGVAFYLLHPILTFSPELSSGTTSLLTFLSGGIALLGSTQFFARNVVRFSQIGVCLVLMVTLVNVALAYNWIDPNEAFLWIAGTLSIPTGILWLFVLKHMSEDTAHKEPQQAYTLSSVFSSSFVRIGGAVVLLISAFLIFYRLGYFDIWEDENLVINAAVGLTEQGWSYFDEGYTRARVHTIIIAGLFELFGDSEFIGRLPSAVFGVCFVLVAFFVFARWYGLAWLAVLLPLICLMNDRFLLLFRYMRMYALLIPLFLAGIYLIYRTIEMFQHRNAASDKPHSEMRKWGMVALSVAFILLLAHIHKLSMILLPVFGLFIVYRALVERTQTQLRVLWVVSAGVALLLFLTFIVELDAFNMFRQVAKRITTPHTPKLPYFEYVLDNALPQNVTLMALLAGVGLLFAKVSGRLKSLLVLNYLFIIIALVSMVYLIGDRGRDYRYIAHLVPFVVCSNLVVVYYSGRIFSKRIYPWSLFIVLLISAGHLGQQYERIYVRHPWAPRYSQVYETLVSNFTPGDALIVQNVKTYYLDPEELAGDHLIKIPKREAYTLNQFKDVIRQEKQGWVMWELHKSHHMPIEIRKYIYRRFKPYHNGNIDDLGVELFYFDETMIPGG